METSITSSCYNKTKERGREAREGAAAGHSSTVVNSDFTFQNKRHPTSESHRQEEDCGDVDGGDRFVPNGDFRVGNPVVLNSSGIREGISDEITKFGTTTYKIPELLTTTET